MRKKNRFHKTLESCGIKLSCVLTDIDGVSARLMITALVEGQKEPAAIAGLV